MITICVQHRIQTEPEVKDELNFEFDTEGAMVLTKWIVVEFVLQYGTTSGHSAFVLGFLNTITVLHCTIVTAQESIPLVPWDPV